MSIASRNPLLSKRLKSLDDPRVLDQVVRSYLESLDTPISLGVYLRFKYKEHLDLVNMSHSFSGYRHDVFVSDRDRFGRDYAAVNFLSKYPGLSTGLNCEMVAYEKFLDSEAQCYETNTRLSLFEDDFSEKNRDMHVIFHIACRKISSILGPVPSLRALNFGFGPGSSSSCGGDKTSVYEKLQSRLDVTLNCSSLSSLIDDYPLWLSSQGSPQLFLVDGGELMFVPKNAKTHRAICVEPTVNGFLQRGVGQYIRARLLKKIGLDLRNQSKNQVSAEKSSVSGTNCTIDLKAASDTISSSLVLALLPIDWFDLLNAMRSHSVSYSGFGVPIHHHLEKFSSMGNGFTFELETLIFRSLVASAMEFYGIKGEILCYGDDIICPSEAYDRVVAVLSFCGFETNLDKSFHQGHFRESCGGHFFGGFDVKPLFLREELTNAKSIIKLANAVSRFSSRRNGSYGRDKSFKRCHKLLVNLLESRDITVPRGPEGYGDGHLISNWDEVRPKLRRKYYDLSYQSTRYEFSTIVESSATYMGSNPCALLGNLLSRLGCDTRCSVDGQHRARRSLYADYNSSLYFRGLSSPTVTIKAENVTPSDDDKPLETCYHTHVTEYDTPVSKNKRFSHDFLIVYRRRSKTTLVTGITHFWLDLGPWC